MFFYLLSLVWLHVSSPNLMPEARSHVRKVGVASDYTHTLRASSDYIPNTHIAAAGYNSTTSLVSHMDSHQQ